MSIVLIVCVIGIAYVWLGQDVAVVDDFAAGDLLSPGFLESRKMRKVQDILESLELDFLDYDIYKKLRGEDSLPSVSQEEIGNDQPFQTIDLIPQSF